MSYRVVYRSNQQYNISLLFARVASFVFVGASLLAMLLSPHYDISKNYLSDLGVGSQTSILFNISVMTTALLLFPAFISLYHYLRQKVKHTGIFFLKFALYTALLALIFLFFVGMFPIDRTQAEHNFSASMFMLFLSMSFSSFSSLLIIFDSHQKYKDQKIEDYLGFIFIPLVFLFSDLALWFSQLLQKVIVYMAILYLLYLINRFYELNSDREVYYHFEKFKKEETNAFDLVMIMNRINF